MAAEFVNIKLEDMDTFLREKGFAPITLAGTLEAVYAKRVDKNGLTLSLRVYTGIVDDDSRGVGEDAIRVTLFTKNVDGDIRKVGGSKRVHRVKGWKANLQSRLDKWAEALPDSAGACDKCGSLMVKREGKNGAFLGCTGYPKCKNTRNLE